MQLHLKFISILFFCSLCAFFIDLNAQPAEDSRPNIVILLADDMGYGDLSSYGHPTIKTPNIDRLADDGIRFTSFVTGRFCVPSRTQLLTGRYMRRIDFGGSTGANGTGGLPERELTLAEGLKAAGYATGMAGKWHLGHYKDQFLPTNQGFDSWFGIPYSNDYKKPWVQTDEPLALYRGTEVVEHPINQDSLTVKYTEEAVNFIKGHANDDRPFFFYLAYNMPHLPIHTTEEFRGHSKAGLYGDVIETIDWSIKRIHEVLDGNGLKQNTIVFFASDNGPWSNMPDRMKQAGNKLWHTGSSGPLRGAKGTTYEGGQRVPAMISWPGYIKPAQVSDALVSTTDIYHTFMKIGNAELPDLTLDGYNMLPFLIGKSKESPRYIYPYFKGDELEAMRMGDWKLRLSEEGTQLFNLQVDPGERFNRAEENPEIVRLIRGQMQNFMDEMQKTENQIKK